MLLSTNIARPAGLLAAVFLGLAVDGATAADLHLPDPLTTTAGAKVTTVEEWKTKRRPELLEIFRDQVYGRAPIGRPDTLKFEVIESSEDTMGGAARRKQVKISYSGAGGEGAFRLILFTPKKAEGPAPCFLFICNRGLENIDPTREKKSPFWP